MRYLVALACVLLAWTAQAQEWEDRQLFNEGAPGPGLRIVSSTDTELFAPIILGFVAENPDIPIEYLVTGTADLDRKVRENPDAFDIAISSAMDLQLKLANDGFARRLSGVAHPPWATWRSSLFAFTSEPAAILINQEAFAGHPIPRSRQELIEAMRARPDVFHGRVGTYDVRQSGLGYLFATQDARSSETFWRLMEVMGSMDVRLYCCSGEMIDDLTDGTLAVAYNVLGSYAAARVEGQEKIGIVLPSDYPTTMMRTAFVLSESSQPEAAEAFVRHLLTLQSSATDGQGPLPSLLRGGEDRKRIALEPALMTFLDSLKRRKFLSEWEDAVIQR